MPEFQLMDSLQQGKTPSGWLGKLLRFGVILLVLALILYLLLNYFYLRFLDKKVAELENKIQRLEQEIPSQDRQEVAAFYSQLVNLKNLLAKHLYPSQVFERLELITHPQVAFTNFDYDFNERRIKMDGYGFNLRAVAEQLLALQRTSDFEKVTVSDVRQSAVGKVNFNVEVFFKPDLVLRKF